MALPRRHSTNTLSHWDSAASCSNEDRSFSHSTAPPSSASFSTAHLGTFHNRNKEQWCDVCTVICSRDVEWCGSILRLRLTAYVWHMLFYYSIYTCACLPSLWKVKWEYDLYQYIFSQLERVCVVYTSNILSAGGLSSGLVSYKNLSQLKIVISAG